MIDRFLRDTINLILYSGAFIGLCAACVTALSLELCGRTYQNISYSLLVGVASAALYAIHRIIGLDKSTIATTSERFVLIRKYQAHIRIYAVIWTLLTLWISYNILQKDLLLQLLPGGVIAAAYVLPVLPGGRRIRDLGWAKIIMVGWSWGWLTAFIPLWYFAESSIQLACIHGLERMLFVMLLVIPFEIRDIHVDRMNGLVTLPEKLGVKKTKRLAMILGTLVVLFSFLASFHYLNPGYGIAIAIISLSIIPLIQYSYTTDDDYFFSGLSDGMFIILLWTFLIIQYFI